MKTIRWMLTIWAVLVASAAAGQELAVRTPGFTPRSSDIADGPALKITVYVYNYARASAPVLEQAWQEVGRVYRTAGVEADMDRLSLCR